MIDEKTIKKIGTTMLYRNMPGIAFEVKIEKITSVAYGNINVSVTPIAGKGSMNVRLENLIEIK